MPMKCPRKGKMNTAMTLKRKIVEMEKTMSLSFAPMTGATAAMAEPPQIAVPAPMSVRASPSTPKSLPAPQATRNAVASVDAMTASDCEPTDRTW